MSTLAALAIVAPGAPIRGRRHGAEPPASLIAQGHALFVTNCAPCHGADAEGDDGPNLHHRGLDDAFIAATIKSGFKGEMPPSGGKLKIFETKALVAYVHSVQK